MKRTSKPQIHCSILHGPCRRHNVLCLWRKANNIVERTGTDTNAARCHAPTKVASESHECGTWFSPHVWRGSSLQVSIVFYPSLMSEVQGHWACPKRVSKNRSLSSCGRGTQVRSSTGGLVIKALPPRQDFASTKTKRARVDGVGHQKRSQRNGLMIQQMA